MKIGYISNSPGNSGVGRRAEKIMEYLMKIKNGDEFATWAIDGVEGKLSLNGQVVEGVSDWPGVLGSKSINWIRLGHKVRQEADLFDITNQTLSWLAKRLQPAVVTVHDLIELIEPQDKKAYWLNRYLYSGINKTDKIIAVSHFTAKEISERYGIAEANIRVIYNGVEAKEFYPIEGWQDSVAAWQLKSELKLNANQKVILYVGSEHPRKNIKGVLEVLMRSRQKIGDVKLIKVGGAGIASGREAMLTEIDRLQLRTNVKIVENVSGERLNELYNLADVLIMPSRYEGFGLPVLEAFSAGTPVICSNATSLPEIAGEAAVMKDYDDIEGMAEAVAQICENDKMRAELVTSGIERAKKFTWEKAASEVGAVYREMV